MSTAVALRVQRHYARSKAGKRCFQIECDEVGLSDALISAGLLDSNKDLDRTAIKLALERMIEIFVMDERNS